ncbi:MAG: hypothetical protein COC17_05335 [Hyphomicrobiales bacterium]|nr:hypothetical protein [Hyphomicrobiales bacterium]PCH50353.1 MAG: hypothetical protein COC17_05335 [Hyphomicrobiales bacterium]
MQLIGHLIIRLIAIIFGVSLAIFASSIFISFGMFTGMFEQFFTDVEYVLDTNIGDTDPIVALLVIGAGFFSSFKIVSLAIIPIFLAISLAEGMRWQGLTINLVMGGVVSLFAGITAIPSATGGLPSDGTLVILLATGFIGGFVYWLIAGRSAGLWLSSNRRLNVSEAQDLDK